MRDALASALLAAQFLTRLPLPARGYSPVRWSRAPHYFAAVGLGLGGGLGALLWGLSWLWPVTLVAIVVLAVGYVITGALHEDGFADCLDGLGGGRDRAHALDIMRDSQIGSFGALGLVVVVALQATALATAPVGGAIGALVMGHTLSRAMMARALGQGRYLRAQGAGSGLDRPLGSAGWALNVAAVVCAALLVLPLLGAGGVVASLAGGLVSGAIWRAWTLRKLGGDTGDTLGALQVVSLTGCFLGAAAWG